MCRFANRATGLNTADKSRKKDGSKSFRTSEPDQFVFDCGSGVCANYNTMGISLGRMNKIFLTHLHGDHISDLIHIYCFGAVTDRKSPLFVWGGGPTEVKCPKPPRRLYDDGLKAFYKSLREACRWHSESQSFISTSYESYEPPTRKSWGLPCEPNPVGDDAPDDVYAVIPIELDLRKYGKVKDDNVAYYNPDTGDPLPKRFGRIQTCVERPFDGLYR